MKEQMVPTEKERVWHTFSSEAIASLLSTNIERGLDDADAEARIKTYGRNIFEKGHKDTFVKRIYKQVKSPLIIILLVAGLFTILLHEFVDAFVILLAVVVNISIGTFQEERASQAFDKLKESQEHYARVKRNGRVSTISAENLVPGDIIRIDAGASIPADVRLTEAHGLLVNESLLTGEWAEVSKHTRTLKDTVSIVEQKNMAWMGTIAVSGHGIGIVVATGVQTEVGTIAESLGNLSSRNTPIQENITRIARLLLYIVLVAIALIAVLGFIRGESITEIILLSIAVAVAVVPEGLPAAVTVVLALGMERILKKGGLVRNLLAAETLGSTTVIVTDKTGTLTEGKMTLESLVPYEHIQNKITQFESIGDSARTLLVHALSASDAFMEYSYKNKKLEVSGRPIERAIALYGESQGLSLTYVQDEYARFDFKSFESRSPFAAALSMKKGGEQYVSCSGSPEYLLLHADSYMKDGKTHKLTDAVRKEFLAFQALLGKDGKRLIGISFKKANNITEFPKDDAEKILKGTVFAGFIVFSDPIRKEVPEAIKRATDAGARVIMVTGDNQATALRIARDVGIVKEGQLSNTDVLTGDMVARMNDTELAYALEKVYVCARILPKQKMRIVSLLKDAGEIVAMTGDGINDAPALGTADIGIAVGSGTDVAKEASDLILLNDSFSIIVHAVEEGRKIIDNLKKIITYLLSTSFGEIYLVIGSLLIGGPLPILPVQVLWVNIIGNGLMSFAFAFEPGSDDAMKRSPRTQGAQYIFSVPVRKMIAMITISTGILLIVLYLLLLRWGFPIEHIRSMMFVALTLDTFFFTFSLKEFYQPIWKVSFFSNTYLLIALGVSAALLVLTFTLPLFREVFSVIALTPIEIMILVGIALFNLVIIELAKYLFFKKEREALA